MFRRERVERALQAAHEHLLRDRDSARLLLAAHRHRARDSTRDHRVPAARPFAHPNLVRLSAHGQARLARWYAPRLYLKLNLFILVEG